MVTRVMYFTGIHVFDGKTNLVIALQQYAIIIGFLLINDGLVTPQ